MLRARQETKSCSFVSVAQVASFSKYKLVEFERDGDKWRLKTPWVDSQRWRMDAESIYLFKYLYCVLAVGKGVDTSFGIKERISSLFGGAFVGVNLCRVSVCMRVVYWKPPLIESSGELLLLSVPLPRHFPLFLSAVSMFHKCIAAE